MYKIEYHKRVLKELERIKKINLSEKTKELIDIIRINPFKNPPPYEKLCGDLKGFYSRRINIKHRLVYQVFESKKIIRIISVWSHYESIWIYIDFFLRYKK